MNYIDIDFPENLSNCFVGGTEFLTTISATAGKKEIRNSTWNSGRKKYNLIYKNCSQKTYEELQTFFILCKGQQKAFNFFFLFDNKITNQLIATGDGTTKNFPIFKTYAYNNLSIRREIQKVKNVKVFFNNAPVSSEKYSITDGTITFADDNIPQINDYIYIDCNFYTIVRFSNDFLPVIRKSNNLFELPDITLIEVQK